MAFLKLVLPLLLGTLVAAVSPRPGGIRLVDKVSDDVWHRTNGTKLPSPDTVYYFDQLIDHDDPSLGTFKQRYWFGYQYYEPGGPIILMNPGEQDASGAVGYLDNQTITGYIADRFNGAVIVLEQRFFGESNPYPDLSVKSFRVHTLQQAIDDLEYFAKNVSLPMPGGDRLSAPGKAPWILVGGSYSGALTSYAMYNKPNLFYAGYASSAVVEAIADFWGYFEPIRLSMPKNCSADVEAVISFVDEVLMSKNASQIKALKENFGLGGLSHDDDFAAALYAPLQDWQDLQPTYGPGGAFYEFCDALEVDDGSVAGPEGRGLENALLAWGEYYRKSYISSYCGSDVEECFGTYNASSQRWTSTEVNNSDRSWEWLTCTEFGFWFDGAPKDRRTLVSRTITPAYSERQCVTRFAEAFNQSAPVSFLNALGVNMKYGGWNTTTERLIFVNGQRDPWREATVAADGVSNQGTDLQPHLLGDGFHCSDMIMADGQVSPAIGAAQEKAIEYLRKWLADWKPSD
ncbi:peptidase S28 [Pilatotrama ljubarskyi]|nr:peptidase S28 [Pilatotrama ljubarskyi]